ncbi:MAG: hypothetical protein RLZZ127_517 [Planctomycetota bacterium]|jgi:ribosome-associated protein
MPKAPAKPRTAAKPVAKAPAKPRTAAKAAKAPAPSEDLARALQAARFLNDKGCEAVRILALPPGSAVADYVVLGTARSDRQLRAAVEDVRQWAKESGFAPRAVEGETGWLLIDCHSVVVHAFLPEERERYQLDSLWPDARDLAVDGSPVTAPVPMPDAPAAPRLRRARAPAALPAPKARPLKGRPAKGSRAPKDG